MGGLALRINRAGGSKWHTNLFQESASVLIVACIGGDLNLESETAGSIRRWHFREHGVLLESDCVVSVSVQLCWETAEVADAWEDVADEAVEECLHLVTAESDHGSDDETLTSLEGGNSFLCGAECWLLACNALETINDVLLHFLSFHLRSVDTDVDDHLCEGRKSMDIADPKLFFESITDWSAEPIMKGCVCHGGYALSRERRGVA